MDDDDLEFRRQLYNISTRLSTEDVSNIKFYCTDDYLSRRQLDAVHSGFHLFCLLIDKGVVSKDDRRFLEELLDLVHKKNLLQLLCRRPLEEGGASPFQGWSLADPVFKPLLKEIGDSLPQKELRDVVYFFSGGALAVRDAEDMKRPEDVFQKLKDGRISIRALLTVFEAIGRRDLCEKVRNKCANMQATTEVATPDTMHADNQGRQFLKIARSLYVVASNHCLTLVCFTQWWHSSCCMRAIFPISVPKLCASAWTSLNTIIFYSHRASSNTRARRPRRRQN